MKPAAKEYKGTLGGQEAFLVRSLAEERRGIFTIRDVSRLVGTQAKEVVRRLAAKKWVLPLKRADAFVVHNFVIASMLAEPYYIGYWSALNHHGLTDQIPRTTFIATTKARHAVQVHDAEYYFVKLARRKFFGWVSGDSIFNCKVSPGCTLQGLRIPTACGPATGGLREACPRQRRASPGYGSAPRRADA
jgi:predicted transcriptional regulator of viral defense system